MKKLLALLMLTALGFFAVVMVVENDLIADYGQVNLENRVSNNYVYQNSDSVEFGVSENLETGSANAVTSIVTGYRSFDTLGEVTVLFVSALGISLMMGTSSTWFKRQKSGFILKTGSKVIMPLIMIAGVYVITHGHLSPGGGFQGGAMIASAVLLMALSDPDFMPNIKAFKLLEGFSGTVYIIIGLLGILLVGSFLQNIDQTGIVGELFSGGFIPIVYLFIGLKVGAELTGIITDFMKEEANI